MASSNLSGRSFGTGITNATQAFSNCSKCATIYVASGTNLSYITTSTQMFTNCTKLVGGAGTAYSSSNVTATYARIDGLGGSAGYFTAKSS